MADPVSPSSQQQQLSSARLAFLEGIAPPQALVPDSVVRSWERSRQAGLVPWQRPDYDLLPARHNVRESAADRRLYRCVHAEVEQLWSAFGGPSWTIFCANPEGVVVHARHAPGDRDRVLAPIVAGRRMAERDIGTTAPACALAEGHPAIVDGNQHYLAEFADTFCLSVPLWGVDGQVIGALDITGHGRRDVGALREQFGLAALSAEQRLFESLRHCRLLRVHHDARWLTTPLAGTIALEDDGRVRAISRQARRMLGLARAGMVRTEWDALFELSGMQRRRLLQSVHARPQRVTRPDGSHLWTILGRAPLIAEGATVAQQRASAVAAPAGLDLREHALHTVATALRAHEGNVAATARALGISRTTLYGHLGRLRDSGLE